MFGWFPLAGWLLTVLHYKKDVSRHNALCALNQFSTGVWSLLEMLALRVSVSETPCFNKPCRGPFVLEALY